MNINQNKPQNHSYYMRLALQQAHKSLGNTKTNPSVGCVITSKNHVISAGFTSVNGRPHAEKNAINSSKNTIRNCNLYVTLEPCSHYGKTPPCTNIITRKKVKKVFFSINDPDKRSFNKSSNKLKKKGIYVQKGILKSDINLFYRSYIKNKKSNLPFVTGKLAVSKDYYSINKNSKWITNKFSRGRVHLMRSSHDCLITSSQTIIDDNPRLTCRIAGLDDETPTRIIFDKNLRVPITAKIIKESLLYPTIIFCNQFHNKNKKIRLLKKNKVRVYNVPLDQDGNLDLRKSLIKIKKLGFSRIFLESGVNLIINFLNNNLIDDFKLFKSNKNLGNKGNGNFKKYYKIFLSNKKKYIEKVNLFKDTLTTYRLK